MGKAGQPLNVMSCSDRRESAGLENFARDKKEDDLKMFSYFTFTHYFTIHL
jgi:hypothetical protein